MAMSVEAFKARFPQFALTEDATVSASLAAALRLIDTDVCGDHSDDVQALMAAQELSRSPYGMQAGLSRMVGASFVTSFDGPLEQLLRAIGTAHRPVLE